MKIKLIRLSNLRDVAIPARVRQAIALLDKLKPSLVITTRDLAASLGIGHRTLRDYTNHPALARYRHRAGRTDAGFYWGNRRTIAELKRLVKKQQRVGFPVRS